MPDPLIMLCPGQGAQAVAMGKAWADASAEARNVFARADEILGDTLGASLSALCFDGPAERLNQTDAAQPAIYACSVASWRGLLASWDAGENDVVPAVTAGLSLGEYTALHLSGAISFEDGLRLVTLRGRAMQDAAEATPSGMVALIGADESQATELCDRSRGDDVLVPANFNAPGQVVVSGSKSACERAEAVASEMGLRATALPVAGAFHSPLMAPAADRLREALDTTDVLEPRCPVVSNVTARPHTNDPSSIRARLVEQLTSPVRWAASCQWIAQNATGEAHELAPGKTLSGLMRRIDRNVKVTSHDTPD